MSQAEVLRQERAQLMLEMRTTLLDKSIDLTASIRNELDRKRLRCEMINVELRDLESAPRPLIDDPSSEGRSNAATQGTVETRGREAFVRYLRTGEKRDLQTTSDATGGAFIPQQFYPVLTQALKSWGKLVDIVGKESTVSGAPQKVALEDDTANSLHESGEPASVTETDMTLSSTLLETDMLDTGVIKVSIQELQDSAFNFDKFIRNSFGKRFYRGLTQKVTNGSTSGNIEKILNANVGATSATAGGTTIDFDDITALWASLDPAYLDNSTFVMNQTTRGLLLGVKDSLGRPLYVPAPSSEAFDTLLGRPVVLNQSAPNVGSGVVGPIQFGSFEEGYLLRTVKPEGGDGPGFAIVRLNERYMDTLQVGFIGYVRAAGLITDAGTHPIQTLKMAT